METSTEKIGGKWKVTFTHDHQTFILDYEGTKEEMELFRMMLDKCFASALGNPDSTSKKQLT